MRWSTAFLSELCGTCIFSWAGEQGWAGQKYACASRVIHIVLLNLISFVSREIAYCRWLVSFCTPLLRGHLFKEECMLTSFLSSFQKCYICRIQCCENEVHQCLRWLDEVWPASKLQLATLNAAHLSRSYARDDCLIKSSHLEHPLESP